MLGPKERIPILKKGPVRRGDSSKVGGGDSSSVKRGVFENEPRVSRGLKHYVYCLIGVL